MENAENKRMRLLLKQLVVTFEQTQSCLRLMQEQMTDDEREYLKCPGEFFLQDGSKKAL